MSVLTLVINLPDSLSTLFECTEFQRQGTLVITECLGETMCTFTIGMAIICLKGHYKFRMLRFLRNILVLLGGLCYLIELVMYKSWHDGQALEPDNSINLEFHSLLMVSFYLVYVLFFIASTFFLRTNSKENSTTAVKVEAFELNWKTIIKRTITPYYDKKFWHKCVYYMMVPVWFIIALFIPVVDKKRSLNGWCKLTACTSFFSFPLIMLMTRIPYIYIYVALGLCGAGLLATLIFTSWKKTPRFHLVFAVIGMLVTSAIFNLIHYEINTLTWQMFAFYYNWKGDSIVLMCFTIGECSTLVVLVYALLKSDCADVAYGLIMGSCTFFVYSCLSLIVFQNCGVKFPEIPISANTATAYYIFLLIISYSTFSFILTGLELRMSHGINLLMLFGIAQLYLFLSTLWIIHPLGTQHSILGYRESSHVSWAR